MTSPLCDPELEHILARLHAASDAQAGELAARFAPRLAAGRLDANDFDAEDHRFLADKWVALDRDKALFCYQLCRALRAQRVVEAGTSFGVSTLYLAAAVRDNAAASGEPGRVIATEYEPEKAEAARANFRAAGLADHVELRQGDLRETLADLESPVDFALIDVWEVALPALERIAPCLRPGAVVVSDNTLAFRDSYRDYFAFIADPAQRLRTLTLPFDGGLELTVRV